MNNTLWKFLSLFIILAMVGVAGCAPPAPAPTTAPPAAEPSQPTGLAACQGQNLVLASMTDQYVAAFRVLVPQFNQASGANITLDELGYVDLYQKLIADFVGHTGSYVLMTVDIVWSGEFGANQYTKLLDVYMERDKAELQLDDILPVSWTLGEWQGTHPAYPLAGYANVLNYRQDLLAAAGIEPPTTQEALLDAAIKLTDAGNNLYGIALLGAKGPAVAQDYMAWVQQHGGRILDDAGKPVINSAENVEILEFFGELFQYAPPGATDYWWDQRETAFRSGQVAMMEGWSIARAGYEDPEISSIVDNVGGAPCIIKLLEGTQGLGVVLAENKNAAKSVLEAFNGLKARVIVQEFVKEAKGADIRAFVVDGRVVGAMKRQAKEGEFRSNLHRGGKANLIQLSRKEKAAAIKAARVLSLSIAGVDMLQSKRGPLIIEVNSSPGLEGIEGATEVDIAGEIIQYIERNVQTRKKKIQKDRVNA